MNPDYALFILRSEKMSLDEKLLDISLLENKGEKINERMRTKYKHQRESLEFAIELLREFQD